MLTAMRFAQALRRSIKGDKDKSNHTSFSQKSPYAIVPPKKVRLFRRKSHGWTPFCIARLACPLSWPWETINRFRSSAHFTTMKHDPTKSWAFHEATSSTLSAVKTTPTGTRPVTLPSLMHVVSCPWHSFKHLAQRAPNETAATPTALESPQRRRAPITTQDIANRNRTVGGSRRRASRGLSQVPSRDRSASQRAKGRTDL